MEAGPEIKFAKNNRKGLLQDGKHGKRAEVCDEELQSDQINTTAVFIGLIITARVQW